MPMSKVNGIEINYQIDGEGPNGTIVLINGLADDLSTWAYQIPAFVEAGYRVLRFDNRGIGQSERPAGPYSARMLADDAKALVDQLGVRDFHLMGVSMGGMISQEYALAYGSDLRSLTLACTYGSVDNFCRAMFSMWADLAQAIDVPFVMRDVALWAFTGAFFNERQAEAVEFAEAMKALDMGVETYLAQLSVIQHHDAIGRVGAIRTPTLVVAGEEDILIPVRLSKDLHHAISGASWATTPGGHACLWETPEPFNRIVLDFIKSQSR